MYKTETTLYEGLGESLLILAELQLLIKRLRKEEK